MKKLTKALVIGGLSLAVLTPAALAAADEWSPGNMGGRGNGSMDHDCDGSGQMAQHGQAAQHGQGRHGQGQGQQGQGQGDGIQARDGTGPYHDGDEVRPMDGTGEQHRGG